MSPWFVLTVVAAASGASPMRAAILSPGRLPWDAPVVDGSRGLEAIGFRQCKAHDLDNPFTVGPSVRCEADDGRAGAAYRTWGTGVSLEKFVFYPRDVAACRRLVEAAAAGGYAWSEAKDEGQVLLFPGAKAMPARSGRFQLRPDCTPPSPRIEMEWYPH